MASASKHLDHQIEHYKRVKTALMKIGHRGPDETNIVCIPNRAIIGHTRLATFDPQGNKQPVWSNRQDMLIAFNGQIYNHTDLDSYEVDEVTAIANTISSEGPNGFNRFDGAFAVAAYSRNNNTLYLARDRFGEKPLFYVHDGEFFAFASELHALTALLPKSSPVQMNDLATFLRINLMPSPLTGLRNIHQVLPGAYVKFNGSQVITGSYIYRDTDTYPESNELLGILFESFKQRLRGCRPIALALSGGVDSGILALLSREIPIGNRPIATTLCFPGSEFDESRAARTIAKQSALDHIVLRPTFEELGATAQEVLSSLDIPIGDPSLIGELMIAKSCRAIGARVLITGDGADELFMGYRFFNATCAIHHRNLVWRAMLNVALRMLSLFPDGPRDMSVPYIARALYRAAGSHPSVTFYKSVGAFPWNFRGLDKWPILNFSANLEVRDAREEPLDIVRRSMLAHYLPDQVTQRLDRATMLASVEARCPFLSLKVTNFALQRHGKELASIRTLKLPLIELYRQLQGGQFTPKKTGFRIPLRVILRGPLNEFVKRTLLHEYSLSELVSPKTIKRIIREHNTGIRDHHKMIWSLMVLNTWVQRNSCVS